MKTVEEKAAEICERLSCTEVVPGERDEIEDRYNECE